MLKFYQIAYSEQDHFLTLEWVKKYHKIFSNTSAYVRIFQNACTTAFEFDLKGFIDDLILTGVLFSKTPNIFIFDSKGDVHTIEAYLYDIHTKLYPLFMEFHAELPLDACSKMFEMAEAYAQGRGTWDLESIGVYNQTSLYEVKNFSMYV